MGQAKQKLASVVLEEAQMYLRQPCQHESDIAEFLANAEHVVVPRVASKLRDIPVKPRECHTNCLRLELSDPDKEIKMVSGWICGIGHTYILHSVIEFNGGLSCITPTLNEGGQGDAMIFVRDPEITRENETFRLLRRGVEPPRIVRRFPELVIPLAERLRMKVLSGANPMRAGKDFEEALSDFALDRIEDGPDGSTW